MGVSNKMTGTSWHIEKAVRKPNDGRRHKSRCKYYDKVKNYCNKECYKCIGSAYCMNYKE